jgi:hypothetical protein
MLCRKALSLLLDVHYHWDFARKFNDGHSVLLLWKGLD